MVSGNRDDWAEECICFGDSLKHWIAEDFAGFQSLPGICVAHKKRVDSLVANRLSIRSFQNLLFSRRWIAAVLVHRPIAELGCRFRCSNAVGAVWVRRIGWYGTSAGRIVRNLGL